jgi:acyl carrier protein
METTLVRVRRTLSDLFSVSPESVTAETSPATLDAWDSMGHLMLVEALEQEFELQIPPEDVERMKDVGTIVKVLDARAA